jgi:predicted transglutaminase-like protease
MKQVLTCFNFMLYEWLKIILSTIIQALISGIIVLGMLLLVLHWSRDTSTKYNEKEEFIPIHKIANHVTSFTTTSGVKVEVYNVSGGIVYIATKNGNVSITVE